LRKPQKINNGEDMLGIGCDLADVERIRNAIARNGFKERVYTPEEIAYCTGAHGDKAQRPSHPASARNCLPRHCLYHHWWAPAH
jgi:hypothetical protein